MDFLTDAQVAAYGRFDGVPSRPDLERLLFLDDVDKYLIGDRRGDHNRLGCVVGCDDGALSRGVLGRPD